MKLNTKNLQQQQILAKALTSHAFTHGILSTVNREIEKWGIQTQEAQELEISPNYNNTELRVSVWIKDNSLYEKLMDSPWTGLDTKNIAAYYTIEQQLIPGNINVTIHFTLLCDLPTQDLETLKAIGKVKTEPGYINPATQYIECTV